MKTANKEAAPNQAIRFTLGYIGLSLLCTLAFAYTLYRLGDENLSYGEEGKFGIWAVISIIGVVSLLSPWLLLMGAPLFLLPLQLNPVFAAIVAAISIACNATLIYFAKSQEGKPKAHTVRSFRTRVAKRITIRNIVIAMSAGVIGLIVLFPISAFFVTEFPGVAQFFYGAKIDKAYESSLPPIQEALKAFDLTIEPSPKALCRKLKDDGINGDRATVVCSREGRSKTIQLDEAYKADWRTNAKQLHNILLQTGWKEDRSNSEERYKAVGQGKNAHYEWVKVDERSIGGVIDKRDRPFSYERNPGGLECRLSFIPDVDNKGGFGASLYCDRVFYGLSDT